MDDLSGEEESSNEEEQVPASKQTKAPAKQEPTKTAAGKGDADSSSDEEDNVAQEKKAKAVKN